MPKLILIKPVFFLFSKKSVPIPQLGHLFSFKVSICPHSLQKNAPHLKHFPVLETICPHFSHLISAILIH